jgi:hypothetical protein
MWPWRVLSARTRRVAQGHPAALLTPAHAPPVIKRGIAYRVVRRRPKRNLHAHP